MPLVLSENEVTESGISYEDRTGVSYQFPAMYRRLIKPGEQFIYYRGRKRKEGGRQQQVYFGRGRIGLVFNDARDPGRLGCEITDYTEFRHPVPFKKGKAEYLEPGGSRRGYFQRGVRGISEEVFSLILDLASVDKLGTSSIFPAQAGLLATIDRMVLTASQTAANANGQEVTRVVKAKHLRFSTEALKDYVTELLARQRGLCAITGLTLQFDGHCTDPELICSLDRIDSHGHYEPGNIQVVCRFVNRWKSDDTDAGFRRLLELLRTANRVSVIDLGATGD